MTPSFKDILALELSMFIWTHLTPDRARLCQIVKIEIVYKNP